MHAVSIGEAVAILPLVEALGPTVLVTTGTVTSAALLADRLPAHAIHQFAPVDLAAVIDQFLDHWRPDAALWVESELWPTTLRATAARGIPMAMVNARITERSTRRWPKWLACDLLSGFRLVLAQSADDAARFRALGARDVRTVGNLKHAGAPLRVNKATLATLETVVGAAPRWCLASSHPGEDELAITAHRTLSPRYPGLITVIVPRHPERGPALAASITDLPVALRSRGQRLTAGIYIADTLGELGLWFRLIDLVLVGGAFAGKGGHNPLEPARLGAALLLGPDMTNNVEATALLSHASRRVHSQAELIAALDDLLANPAERQRLGQLAAAAAATEAGVTTRVVEALAAVLPAGSPLPP
jgi:3-deoxy-D-manno-octulosonic-acid transferase